MMATVSNSFYNIFNSVTNIVALVVERTAFLSVRSNQCYLIIIMHRLQLNSFFISDFLKKCIRVHVSSDQKSGTGRQGVQESAPLIFT